MGSVDDTEPPSKRVKGISAEPEGLSNHSSLPGPLFPLGGQMARLSSTQGKEEMLGSKCVIKRDEFVRIITKTLYSLGYERSGKALEEESGILLHSFAVSLFRKQVLDGNWDDCLTTLQKIELDEHIRKSAIFLILEYKFFDFLKKDKIMDALKTLRMEISPLNINKGRLHDLSSCIVSSSKLDVLGFSNLSIDSGKSQLKLLEELQNLFPPAVMIPERRLENLVEQALVGQMEACFFHNSLGATMSLYTDHQCGKDQLPSTTLQILQGHDGEVWFLQFSHNGKCLASTSNDRTVIIWEVHEDGEVSLKRMLKGHEKPILTVAWSPDDRYLLSCGVEEVVRCWDANSGECLRSYGKNGLGLLSAVWSPNGKQFFSGVSDKSLSLWDLLGNEVETLSGHTTTKITDMAVAKDGKQIISTYRDNAILLFDREGKADKVIAEDQTITSFMLSSDEKFLLVNLLNEEIHLWSIADVPTLLTKYRGHKRSRFMLRSCFGGIGQSFIASGSEDSKVYIWHRGTGEIIQELCGHSGAVNCVSWNPVYPNMLASGSDDHTIRIWGLNRVDRKRKDSLSNGFVHHCNGTSK